MSNQWLKFTIQLAHHNTDQDAYSLSVIKDILYELGQAKFFSAFELSSRFHQISKSKESKIYTGFSTL